jgi:neutral ceramidase
MDLRKRLIKFLLIFLSFISLNINASELKIGISAVDITPEKGVPLAGYGGRPRRLKYLYDWSNQYPHATYLTPSKGVLDPIRVKTVVLSKNNKKLVFISLDLIGVTSKMIDHILEELKEYNISAHNLIVGATHTHSGPGTLTNNSIMELLAVDKFNEKNYKDFLKKVKKSVTLALNKMEKGKIFYSTFQAHNIQKNRRSHKRKIDKESKILWFKNNKNKILGAIINFAIHGTSLSAHNFKFSSDIPGALERELESKINLINATDNSKSTVLFFNGAVGDIAPREGGFNQMLQISKEWGTQAIKALKNIKEVKPEWTSVKKNIKMNPAIVNLVKCLKKKSFGYALLKLVKLNIQNKLPKQAPLQYVKLGDLTFLTWPGEPNASLGLQLKKLAIDKGHKNPFLLSLTNDHLFYFSNEKEFSQESPESCMSVYGSKGSKKIIDFYTHYLSNH